MMENAKIQKKLMDEGKSGNFYLENYGKFTDIAEITRVRHEQYYDGVSVPGKYGLSYQIGYAGT